MANKVVLDKVTRKVEGEYFYNSNIATALENALSYAGEAGYDAGEAG